MSELYKGKATEFIIKSLLAKGTALAEERRDAKLTPWHISEALATHEEFGCLLGKVEALSDTRPPVKKKQKEESKSS